MNVDAMIMARARLALREAIGAHLFDPNVTLIDFGLPERRGKLVEGELAIRVHVKKKMSGVALEAAIERAQTHLIPTSIGGFPTDVPEGAYRPHVWASYGGWRRPAARDRRATRANPMQCGISISDEHHYTYGTLGSKVIDRATGAEMILSNWHVLAADWGARSGQHIVQPGRLDGGTRADIVATLTRHTMSVNLDAAVATLNGTRELANNQLGLGSVTGVRQAELGMEVVKSGRRTGITYGRISAIAGTARIRYGWLERIIRDVVTVEPRRPGEQVSAGGDSGSVWLDTATMRAIGLHFAGSDVPERGLALDMQAVLDALNVDVAIGR